MRQSIINNIKNSAICIAIGLVTIIAPVTGAVLLIMYFNSHLTVFYTCIGIGLILLMLFLLCWMSYYVGCNIKERAEEYISRWQSQREYQKRMKRDAEKRVWDA